MQKKHKSLDDLYQSGNRLYFPYLLLLGAIFSLVILLYVSVERLNTNAENSTRSLLNNVLKNERINLENTVKDYGHWYAAVENLMLHYKPVWVKSNLGKSLSENHNIARVVVAKSDRIIKLAMNNGQIDSAPPADLYGGDLNDLYNQVSSSDMTRPIAASGIFWIGGELHLVAVSPISSDIDVKQLEYGKFYGFLTFTRKIDSDFLKQWQIDYQFKQLTIDAIRSQIPKKNIVLDVYSPSQRWVSSFVVSPALPGNDFLEEVVPWLVGLFLFLLLMSFIDFQKVRANKKLMLKVIEEDTVRRKELAVSRQQLNYVIDGAELGYWDWYFKTGDHYVNDQWLSILGLSRDDIKDNVDDWAERIHPDDKERMLTTVQNHIRSGESYVADFRMKHKDGRWIWIQGSGAVVEYDAVTHEAVRLCGTHQKITERKKIELALEQQATHDFLTGLYNRVEFEKFFSRELERSKRHGHNLSFFLIDLDYFKRINDEYGHQVGDNALTIFSRFLEEVVRKIDFVARFGGEEFVVVLPETNSLEAKKLAERLRHKVADIDVSGLGLDYPLSVSIGVSTYPENGKDDFSLIRAADMAMYTAKEQGRNQVFHANDVKGTSNNS